MIRRIAHSYRTVRAAHPTWVDCAWGIPIYGGTLVFQWLVLGIELDRWTTYLAPLACSIAYVSIGRSLRQDQRPK